MSRTGEEIECFCSRSQLCFRHVRWPGWAPVVPASANNQDLVAAARQQVGVTAIYDGSYRTLDYPGGDVPRERGVCTDVIVRALRTARAGHSRPVTRAATDYLPGNVVAWDLGGGILHVGIVSDRRAVTAVPLVLHNIGAGAREEDILFRYTIIGHYRLQGPRDRDRWPLPARLSPHTDVYQAAIHGRLRTP
jgi:uncharacterized protein YijF (DUF1287 family)